MQVVSPLKGLGIDLASFPTASEAVTKLLSSAEADW